MRRVAVTALVLLCGCWLDGATGPSLDQDATAGTWKTWVLSNGAELRPPAPPASSSSQSAIEIDEIIRLQSQRTPASDSMIGRWSGSPISPWHALALDRMAIYWVLLPDVRLATPARSARAMALLNVAMYDALVATWDAKYTYNRLAPADEDARVRALATTNGVPTYPSEHAAVAGAAAGVLSYLFPREDTLSFHALEREAGEARIVAGAARRSDVDVGYAIGRAVAKRVIARALADGSEQNWTGAVPAGDAMWRPTPNKYVALPFDANAGNWRTWVLSSGSSLRPGPPPSLNSSEFAKNLGELRTLSGSRTIEQANLARYWATDAPSAKWEMFMRDELAKRRWSPVRAARAQALASIAMHDAFVACWDAKFHYWLFRPISADTTLKIVFPTPPFPSYPSGHSTISSAAAEVFADLFPDSAAAYRRRGRDASLSRVYAGVHYRFDVDSGDVLGERIGRAVVEFARQDGSAR